MASATFPVCSSAFLSRHPLDTPRDLIDAPLLRSPRQKWRPWFLSAGLDVPEPSQGPIYDDASLVLQAAATGHCQKNLG